MVLRRSLVVGVDVSANAVRAVALRESCVVWSREIARSSSSGLEGTLADLLDELPHVGPMRPRVFASVGPSSAQVRTLGDAAWARDQQLARAIVAENPHRFFLVNGTPVVTTDVQPLHTGDILAAAIDQPVVDALTVVCRRCHLRLVLVAPAAAVLGYAVDGDRAVLEDGDLSLIASYAGARLVGCRRVRTAELREDLANVQPGQFNPQVVEVGTPFAAAFGAARAERSVQLALRSHRRATGDAQRLWCAVAACAIALAFALIAPPIVATQQADSARAARARIARSGERALALERRLAEAAVELRELDAFTSERRSATLVLASLSEAIEHPTMLLSVQADTLGGTLVALTPRVADMMTMLDSVPEITAARIAGPVTLQPKITVAPVVGPQSGTVRREATPPMERVTVRFAWRPPLLGASSSGSQ